MTENSEDDRHQIGSSAKAGETTLKKKNWLKVEGTLIFFWFRYQFGSRSTESSNQLLRSRHWWGPCRKCVRNSLYLRPIDVQGRVSVTDMTSNDTWSRIPQNWLFFFFFFKKKADRNGWFRCHFPRDKETPFVFSLFFCFGFILTWLAFLVQPLPFIVLSCMFLLITQLCLWW